MKNWTKAQVLEFIFGVVVLALGGWLFTWLMFCFGDNH
jgi:protein-S-isoprenylcysteine O-methyltransferase Ste14